MDATHIAETRSGKILGYAKDGLKIFKGIPFAEPPIGDLRFKPSVPKEPWIGVVDCRQFGAIAPQRTDAFIGSNARASQSERDCLNLNVWTPGTDDKKRPVMFWIHGGGFSFGSGSLVDGASLALNGDVVVVSINYRVGILGYLYLENEVANLGQLDQIAALRWVRDNIEMFGGDPNNVMIFGESAGAVAVVSLMAMPAAKGFFHRAAVQSGSAHPLRHQAASGIKGAQRILTELGIRADAIKALREVPTETIVAVASKLEVEARRSGADFPYGVYVDGKTLPQHPLDAIRDGYAKNIELIIGTNQDEAKLYSALDQNRSKVDDERLLRMVSRILAMFGKEKHQAREMIDTYKRARQNKLPTDPVNIRDAILTDLRFRIPALRIAEAQQEHKTGVYSYLFTYRSPAMGGRLGSCHGLEIPFVFGTLGETAQKIYPRRDENTDILSGKMLSAWSSFARTGRPTHKGIPVWGEYELEKRKTMLFGPEVSLAEDPFAEERRVWEGLF